MFHTLARFTGYFQPAETFQRWIKAMSQSKDDRCRQAFGELLFLHYARQKNCWANDEIGAQLLDGDTAALMGLAYAAADAVIYPHCRPRATDILCEAAKKLPKGIDDAMRLALIPRQEDEFIFDEEAKRLINAVSDGPKLVASLGAELLDAIAPVAGLVPDLALAACKKVLGALTNGNFPGQRAWAAANLTNIALTLHRQDAHRANGLELFESLIAMHLPDAVAALELIDRKPGRGAHRPPSPPIKRRRRPSIRGKH